MLERLRNLIVRHPAAAAFAAAAVLLSFGAAGSEITRIDVRFAVMVGELRAHGAGVFPTINGFPYTDYFSPLILLAYLTTLGGRWINLWSLALPAILLGSAVFALVVAVGEHRRRGLGVIAAALLAASWKFLLILFSFGIDVPVAAATMLMLWSFECHPERRSNPLLFFLLTVVSFAVRGPLGVILFGGATGAYLLASRRWREVLASAAAGFAGSVLAAAAAVWLIRRQGGEELWQLFLDWQIGSRMGSKTSPFYYFSSAILSFTPAAPAAVAAIVIHRRKLVTPEFAGLTCAIVLPLLLLSVPGCKHLRYMAPVLPLCALLGAKAVPPLFRRFSRAAESVTAFLHRSLPWIDCGVFVLFAAAGIFLWRGDFQALPNLAAGVLTALFLRSLAAPAEGIPARAAAIGAALMLLMTAGVFPFINHFESARPTVRRIEALRAGNRIIIYRIGPDHNDLKYRLHADSDAPAKTIWTAPRGRRKTQSYLRKMYRWRPLPQVDFRSGDLVLLNRSAEEEFRALPQIAGRFLVSPALAGKLGHVRVVLLRLERSGSAAPGK